jgi:hypothetical protein
VNSPWALEKSKDRFGEASQKCLRGVESREEVQGIGVMARGGVMAFWPKRERNLSNSPLVATKTIGFSVLNCNGNNGMLGGV